MRRNAFLASAVFLAVSATAFSQSAANVSQVVMSSIMTTRPIGPSNTVNPVVTGTLPSALLSVYTYTGTATTVPGAPAGTLTNPSNYSVGNVAALNAALSSNIALSLSLIPLESPTSGVILKSDPLTGASLPVSSTLGPIFTQRAETIGKGKFYLGFTHQNYHFTSLNGQSLNGLPVLYSGGNQSHPLDKDGVTPLVTSPATVNFGMDIRIAQDVAFITYGVTNKLDVSVGLPMVHAAVSASAYNGLIYSGTGFGATNGKCWCVATFSPGAFALTAPAIGQSSMGKTGYGDTIVRVKNIILERPNAVLAAGVDLRFGTGDESNYLGTGTTSVKPFLALSLYSKPLARGIVFAPHAQVGWQYSGKSSLGGTLQGQTQSVSVSTSNNIPIVTGPLSVVGKDYLPDVLSWSVGTEVALGRRNTLVADILGNQIGYVHGVPTVQMTSVKGLSPIEPVNAQVDVTGFAAGAKTSLGQYSGAFGYKTRLFGNLVASFQMLVRFDNNGLTARAVPLYGLGYSF